MSVEILGYAAILFSACASIPQLYQIIKTKKVRDLNPYFFVLDFFACLMYIIYGILIENYIVMGSSIMPLINRFIIIVLWIYYRKENYWRITLSITYFLTSSSYKFTFFPFKYFIIIAILSIKYSITSNSPAISVYAFFLF